MFVVEFNLIFFYNYLLRELIFTMSDSMCALSVDIPIYFLIVIIICIILLIFFDIVGIDSIILFALF